MAKSKALAETATRPPPTSSSERQRRAPDKQGGPQASTRASPLRPHSAAPAPARAAALLGGSEAMGGAGRARMSADLQRSVGNARAAQMLANGADRGAAAPGAAQALGAPTSPGVFEEEPNRRPGASGAQADAGTGRVESDVSARALQPHEETPAPHERGTEQSTSIADEQDSREKTDAEERTSAGAAPQDQRRPSGAAMLAKPDRALGAQVGTPPAARALTEGATAETPAAGGRAIAVATAQAASGARSEAIETPGAEQRADHALRSPGRAAAPTSEAPAGQPRPAASDTAEQAEKHHGKTVAKGESAQPEVEGEREPAAGKAKAKGAVGGGEPSAAEAGDKATDKPSAEGKAPPDAAKGAKVGGERDAKEGAAKKGAAKEGGEADAKAPSADEARAASGVEGGEAIGGPAGGEAAGAGGGGAAPATEGGGGAGGGAGAPAAEGGGGGGEEAAVEGGPQQEPEAEATERRMDEAQQPPPAHEEEQAEGEGAGGGGGTETGEEEDSPPPAPDAGEEAAAIGEAAGGENGGASEAAAAPSPEAPTAASGAAAGGATSSSVAAEPAVAPAEEAAESAPAESPDEGEPQASAAPAGGSALDPGEQQAALQSLGEGAGGGGEAAVGGGGGGGGGAISEPPAPEAPDVSQADPEQALSSVANLPPAQLQTALGSVGGAVANSVGEQREELAANPPEMERPSGAPVTLDPSAPSAADAAPPPAASARTVARAPEGQPAPIPEAEPLPPPPPPPTQTVATPAPRADAQGEVSSDDVRASIRTLPTTDPGLDASAGPAPRLALEGNADPQRARDQRLQLEHSVGAAQADGAREAAQPMGEANVYPRIPRETLRANSAGGGPRGGAAGGGSAAAAAGGDTAEAASIIAQEERGDEIRGAVAQAQGEMASRRQEHRAQVGQARAQSQQEIAQEQQRSAAQQSAERGRVREEVQQQRGEWTAAQAELVDRNRAEADRAGEEGEREVATQQSQGNAEATEHVARGEREAGAARRAGEQEAAQERQRGEAEAGGLLSWISSKVGAFFDGIKRGIQKAFEKARAAVRAAIDGAKKLAVAAIEKARQAVVAAIRKVGERLIAIGDVVLAGFPALRDRFRNVIKDRVSRAEAAVNALAEKLKVGVQKALDALGGALDAALGLLERGLLAAVDAVKKAVQGAIQFANSLVQAAAAFAALIKDIAANPGQWLRNLGAAVVDGVRNHLWKAFKEAVKGWFNQKVEEVLGLGLTVWNVIKRGGIDLAQIGQMAWEGIKQAIPPALIQILVEKVVAMIVPAAGAVMAIIEGLQAAWGTVSRIIQAFQRFIAFLKAVKGGSAGPLFANALAAAAIAVIDFVANWLLKRLRKPAGKVAGKIRAIARKIMQKLKRVAKRIGRALKRVGRRIRRSFRRMTARFRQRRGKRKRETAADRERKKRERLDKAVRELPPKITRLIGRGVSRLRLRAQLAIWRLWYRIRTLSLDPPSGGRDAKVVAANSPGVTVAQVFRENPDKLYQMVLDIARERFGVTDEHGPVVQAGTAVTQGGVSIPAGRDPLQLGAGIRQRATDVGEARLTPPTSREPLDLGIGGATVAAEHGAGVSTHRGRTNVIISDLGAYPEITQQLADEGYTHENLPLAIQQAGRTGTGPARPMQMLALLYGAEAGRTDIAAATSTLTLVAAQRGTTVPQLFGDPGGGPIQSELFAHERLNPELVSRTGDRRQPGGGIAPYTAVGAREAATRAASERAPRPGTQIAQRTDAEVLRTVELVYRALKGMDFRDAGDVRSKTLELMAMFERGFQIG